MLLRCPSRMLTTIGGKTNPVLDEWLRKLSSKNLKVTVAARMEHTGLDDGQPLEVRQARTKQDRFMDAIEKGMDPALYVERSRTARRQLAAATAVIRRTLPCRRATRHGGPAPRSVGACRRPCRACPPRRCRRTARVLPGAWASPRLPGPGRTGKDPRLLRHGVFACRRGDLNPHALAGTSPSS